MPGVSSRLCSENTNDNLRVSSHFGVRIAPPPAIQSPPSHVASLVEKVSLHGRITLSGILRLGEVPETCTRNRRWEPNMNDVRATLVCDANRKIPARSDGSMSSLRPRKEDEQHNSATC